MAELLRNFWQLGWILYGASLGPVRYFGHSCEILYAERKMFEIEMSDAFCLWNKIRHRLCMVEY